MYNIISIRVQWTRVCMNHFHKDVEITHYIFPCTEGEPNIIVSIDYN